jgi:hypothetical protein
MNSALIPALPPSHPPELKNLTRAEIAELAAKTEFHEGIRAEVCRRLSESPQKANYLTFRWLIPLNEGDKANAFDGLMACCWNAVKKRHAFNDYFPDWVQTAREAILDELVTRLSEFSTLSIQEVIHIGLGGDFRTDADVANAVRRRVRQERRYLRYAEDIGGRNEDGEYVSLFEISPEDVSVTSKPNPHHSGALFVQKHKPRILEAVGETGWVVLSAFVELSDDGLLPGTQREQGRVWTDAIAAKLGIGDRQARTYKDRLIRALYAETAARNSVIPEITNLLNSTAAKPGSNGNGSSAVWMRKIGIADN